ncbi:MAG: tRNA lysidine(34) synthetase TilS [Planctomycetes bacterium]|nr:tRNA lysidine(34) synthetase TilS [Planctomycetota bacterium]
MIQLPENFNRVGVAFSGGKDSAVLLHLLKNHDPSVAVVALHVNHGVRSQESCKAECDFVRSFCDEQGVSLCEKTLSLEKDAGENTLRKARYLVLAEMAQTEGLQVVALGHHRQDQTESFLMHMLRGADLRGLSPMKDDFQREGMRFMRPLLGWSPEMLSQYAEKMQLKHFEDPTNRENHYRRNKLRNQIIPKLEDYHSGCSERIAELSEAMGELLEWRDGEYEKAFAQMNWHKNAKGELLVSRKLLQDKPLVLLREWAYRFLSEKSGGTAQVNRGHVHQLVDFIHNGAPGYHPTLFPGRLQVRAQKRKMVFFTLSDNSD